MIYRPISGDLSTDISNIGHFLLQTIFLYRIGSRQKKRYQTMSRPTRPIFKTRQLGKLMFSLPAVTSSKGSLYIEHRTNLRNLFQHFFIILLYFSCPWYLVIKYEAPAINSVAIDGFISKWKGLLIPH